MPNLKPLALAAIAVVLTASAALAASPAPKAGEHRQKKTFEVMDTNKDGGVSLDELKAGFKNHPRKLQRADKMFKRLDANTDGKIDKAEFDAWKAKRHERKRK